MAFLGTFLPSFHGIGLAPWGKAQLEQSEAAIRTFSSSKRRQCKALPKPVGLPLAAALSKVLASLAIRKLKVLQVQAIGAANL